MAAENRESRAIYKVSSIEMVKNIVFKEHLFVAASAVFFIVLFVLPTYILYFGTPMKDSDLILFYLQYSFIVVFLILFIYSAMEMRVMRKTYPVYVRIDDKGIETISSEGVKNLYPYKEFKDRTHINIYFSNDSNRSFHSMKDFVRKGIPYIEDRMRESDDKKRPAPRSIYIRILKPTKVTHIFRPYIRINIHAESIGGPENLKKMLNDWKHNYEEYLKGIGEYRDTNE